MLNHVLRWLDYEWWGLAVAYVLLFGSSYGLIWWLIEPLNVPDQFELLPNLLKQRWFHHLLLAILIASHGVIVIELWRRKQRRPGQVLGAENRRLKRILRSLGQAHKRAYKYVRDTIDREIEEDGTDIRTRTMLIAAIAETISWIDIGFGTTAANPEAQGVTYDKPEITDERGRALAYEVYEEGTSERRILIFFTEPLRVGDPPRTIRIVRQRTHRTWMELLEELVDVSVYQARNDVDEVVLTLGVPPSLRVDSLQIDPHVGHVTTAADRMSVTWSASGLTAGTAHRYTLRCLRTRTSGTP